MGAGQRLMCHKPVKQVPLPPPPPPTATPPASASCSGFLGEGNNGTTSASAQIKWGAGQCRVVLCGCARLSVSVAGQAMERLSLVKRAVKSAAQTRGYSRAQRLGLAVRNRAPSSQPAVRNRALPLHLAVRNRASIFLG